MNERIKELSKQADEYADSLGLSGAEWCDAQNEKFVELVIRECIERIKRVGILEDIENETDMVVDSVKDHFGVQ